MAALEFEWDAAKAAQNAVDHGVSFDMAKGVFEDPFALEWTARITARITTSLSAWSTTACSMLRTP
jgi:uncharacterized DUF497 family protein